MPKSNLTKDVEQIADRVSKKNIRESKAIVQLGTWIKNLSDENRQLKQRIELLEIWVKKINDHGPTLLSKSEAAAEEAKSQEKAKSRLTGNHLKRFRQSRSLSQASMGALLEVSVQKYARWESGRSQMAPEVESRFAEIQNMKASELRSKLQELGFFQANGKKTKIKGADDTPEKKVRKYVAGTIISNVQIKELRLALGYTQPQLGELIKTKGKTVANWEYGYCRPPEQIAKRLLTLYNEHVGPSNAPAEPVSPPEPISATQADTPETKGDAILTTELLRAGRKASGLTVPQIAQRLRIAKSTYWNWESGRTKPNTPQLEALLQMFGNPPTESAQKAMQDHAKKPSTRRTPRKSGLSQKKISPSQIRELRESLQLSYGQMAQLIGVKRSQYQNWEAPDRGVPANCVIAVQKLMAMRPVELQTKIKALGITPAGRFLKKDEEA